MADAQTRYGDRYANLERSQRAQKASQGRLAEFEDALQALEEQRLSQGDAEAHIDQQISQVQGQIEPVEDELRAAESDQAQLEQGGTALRQAVSAAEHYHAQARIGLARKQEELASLQRRIEDDFGLVAFEYAEQVSGPTPLPLAGMVEQLPRVEQINPEVEELIKRQRAQLRRMGPVNPEAQAEYQEVKARFEFLTEQTADLHRAEADVRQVIAELDALMQREFHHTFDAVAAEFRQIFTRLFGGGSARLALTDPEQMAETGIDIEARLPGRRTQSLALLSGGERSLTATALIFALLKVSPTPFCVLDEVDAMLDEVNVGRFRDLLGELSQKTQFVIITHNRNTVQVADAIYGVTMGRDSSSQVISLRLDEVPTIVE
jgi:chromosome segregation protein